MKEALYSLIALSLVGLAVEVFSRETTESNFSLMSKADKQVVEGKIEKAIDLYEQCLNKKEGETAEEKQLSHEYCLIHKARALFKDKRLEEALELYDTLPKSSYLWPVTLVEKAWIFYKKGDYNRTLGLLATYKSPLLQSYFIPEVEVLNALVYFRLCLWDDSFSIVQDYEAEESKAKELKAWIANKGYKTIDLNTVASFDALPYGRTLWLQLLHRPWVKTEKEKREILAKLASFLVSEVERASQDLFSISLELYTKKKSLIYKKEKLISDRYRGDLSNVHRKVDQYFWDFRGEFFADELGDYSFGLKSNCETVRKGGSYESQ